MKDKFVCSICGKTHYDLGEYVNCVTRCSEQLKKYEEQEKEKKRLEELNAALNRVKQAKAYFEQQLNEFKDKYPEEYRLNFAFDYDTEECDKTCDDSANDDKCDTCDVCDGKCLYETNKETDENECISITYIDDGHNKPELSASINGKKVSDDALEKLFKDPDANHIARLIKIL